MKRIEFRKLAEAVMLCGMVGTVSTGAYAGTATYENHSGSFSSWGTRKAEVYNVGTFIPGERFAGLTLNKIEFPVTIAEGIDGFSIWVAGSLEVSDGEFKPDVACEEVKANGGTVSLSLSDPYEIGKDGVYIGYTFTVSERDTDEQMLPVKVVSDESDPLGSGIYVYSSRTYKKWTDVSGGNGTFVPFEITVGGLGGNALSFEVAPEVNAGVGNRVEVPMTFYNYGTEPVNSLELTYSYSDGREEKKNVTLDPAIDNRLLASSTVKVPLKALEEKGYEELTVNVTGVNGNANEWNAADQKSKIAVWSYLPVRRPLLEEYTGTGCGYCPRGGVGLEKLAEIYGDLMVGVSYHCADVMSILDVPDYPNPAPAQPTLWIDRMRETDPYFGDRMNGMAFAADEVWDVMQSRFSPVDVVFDCDWENITTDKIEVNGSLTFVAPVKADGLKMVYLVVADGLSKMDPAWFQGNYYSGQVGKWPADLDVFVNATNPIVDMVYNDVAILSVTRDLTSGSSENDLVEADKVIDFAETLNLQDAKNLEGESLLQDREKLRVVVAVYDSADGEVLNCNQVRYGASGVETIRAGKGDYTVSYYNMLGMPVSVPADGEITVEIKRYADGTCESRKIFGVRK